MRDGAARRPLTFVHEVTSIIDSEFARFDEKGRFAMGTTNPTSNIHVYDTTPGNVDIMRLQSTGVNKQTGILLYTNNGEGGFMRGFSNTVNKTTGLALGVSNNSTIINNLNLIHTSNVGVGTPTPARQLHIVDHRNPLLGGTGVMRVESKLSNASVEFTTSAGTSNIYADRTGNVYIQPSSINKPTTFVKSTLNVNGDLFVDGNIDFSQIAVNLGGEAAATDIETGGGIITNSNEVSRKTYSKTFTLGEGFAKNIQIMFAPGAFYAKITAMLRRIDNIEVGDPVGGTVKDINTMVLEVQGGTSDGSAPTLDIAEGLKTMFGGTNNFPWDPVVEYGQRGISLTPYNVEGDRIYAYDVFIELTTACGGKVERITHNLTIPSRLDDGQGGQTDITTFNY